MNMGDSLHICQVWLLIVSQSAKTLPRYRFCVVFYSILQASFFLIEVAYENSLRNIETPGRVQQRPFSCSYGKTSWERTKGEGERREGRKGEGLTNSRSRKDGGEVLFTQSQRRRTFLFCPLWNLTVTSVLPFVPLPFVRLCPLSVLVLVLCPCPFSSSSSLSLSLSLSVSLSLSLSYSFSLFVFSSLFFHRHNGHFEEHAFEYRQDAKHSKQASKPFSGLVFY
jgi:hypothetical protein